MKSTKNYFLEGLKVEEIENWIWNEKAPSDLNSPENVENAQGMTIKGGIKMPERFK